MSIAAHLDRTMTCTCVERGVRKCYQNSYSANISRIDRLYIYIYIYVCMYVEFVLCIGVSNSLVPMSLGTILFVLLF